MPLTGMEVNFNLNKETVLMNQ